MNNDLISREALRNVILNDRKLDGANANWEVNRILVHIDNAPTVFSCNACKNMGNERECVDCHDYCNYVHYDERPQGEYTEEDMKQAIKENFDLGYEMAKNKYERPQGEWIYDENFANHFRCNLCNDHNDDKTNFCPNCGADMRGE